MDIDKRAVTTPMPAEKPVPETGAKAD